ncbi:tyrosine-type recombinase/integrase [Noviherbaspirillum autotrophicum]|uniref:Alpha/beta hydrolase n=1 Tax=Noviherbaspirillum autotrophicum TaxID=709839 RepID=A0A0C1YTR3_9BURK|nr:integrase family protein [Noviherbaspirillum autotrophicum]KIF80799.1 alpha/beta hydrolase [Noviherbaspirillum autotrophicum]KIF80837.1 alpha/beta hydrolase [Noviherbaspirillum autotrophicum]KIF84062.1 alpha/beta hydrolase [Noviherbaspirillum autotrophicum]
MTFDARTAKLLKPGEHITFADHPGLRLESSIQFKTWTYRYKSPVDGKMKQVKIGRWPAMSFHAAVVEWEQAREARSQGQDIAAEKKSERTELRVAEEIKRKREKAQTYTVERLCEDYCKHLDRVRKERGVKEVRRTFDVMIDQKFKTTPAEKVTRAAAFDLLESYAEIPVQAGKLRAELAAAWDYALDAGRIPETTQNWWRRVMRGKLRSKGKKLQGEYVGVEKRHLSLDELRKLIPFLPNLSRNVCDVLTLYIWTGCRGAELVQMTAEEISVEADDVVWWTCPKSKTKNARHDNATDLRVPLFGKAREIVLRRNALYKTGYLFQSQVSKEKHIQQKVIQTSVHWHMPYSMTLPERVRPRFPVTRWSPHDLRRTVRTQLAALGCPDSVAEAVLGHMQPGVKGVYNRHSYDAERVEWLRRWNDTLNSLS